HEPVVGVDRDPETQLRERAERMLGERTRRSRLDVRGRAQLERDPPVPHIGGEPAEPDLTVRGDLHVVGDPHTVSEPFRTAVLNGLPNRRQAESLARVNGEMAIFGTHVLECVEISRGRVASLRSRNIETGDPGIAMPNGEFGDFRGARMLAHRTEQLARLDPVARGVRLAFTLRDAVADS